MNEETKHIEQENLEATAQEETTNGQSVADELASEADKLADAESQAIEQPEDSAEIKLARLEDTHLRLMAEYDNYRKRTLKEKSDLIRNGGEKVLVDLLPVLDDLDIALINIDKALDIDAVKEGMRLIHAKLVDYLYRQGVKAIDTEGVAFDEELHEAIATFPAPDEAQKGKIIDSVRKGYKLHDKVIRHAHVVVGQ